jgi:hypothetical protein
LLFLLPPEPAAPVSPAWAIVHEAGTRIARATKQARINVIVVSLCWVGERSPERELDGQDNPRFSGDMGAPGKWEKYLIR